METATTRSAEMVTMKRVETTNEKENRKETMTTSRKGRAETTTTRRGEMRRRGGE